MISFKRNTKKLLALTILATVTIGLFVMYMGQESQIQLETAQLEMKDMTDDLAFLMDREVGFLEVTAERLDRSLMSREKEDELRARLKYVINRQSYQYGLFISPDRVLNGTELINPSVLMNSGKKRYGDRVFWATPLVSEASEHVVIPIYQPLSEPRLGVSGILYREVKADELMNSVKRLHAERKGVAFFISDEKQVIGLSPISAMSSALTEDTLEKHLVSILGQSFKVTDTKSYIFAERIGSSHWHLVYVEPRHTGTVQFLFLALCLLVANLIIVFVILKPGKPSPSDDEVLRLGNRVILDGPTQESLLMQRLKAEALQIDWLRGQEKQYTQSILSFKLEVLLAALLNKNDYTRTICLKDLIHWLKGYSQAHTTVQIECGTGAERIHLDAEMVYELLSLFEVLMQQEGLKQIEISPDVSNQLLVITLYGEQILSAKFTESILSEKALQGQEKRIQRSFIGNRIVYKLEGEKPLAEKVQIKTLEENSLPKSVVLYAPDFEGHAIVKFYLDYMGLHYIVTADMKNLQDVDVILAAPKAMKQLVEARELGLPITSSLVLCKDESLDDAVLEAACDWIIHRPYSLDKIQQIFYSIQRKKNLG